MDFIIDTETTGLPLFRERSHDPRQPYCLQLAYECVDRKTQIVMNKFSTLIDNKVDIPKEVSALHGVTREMTDKFGASPLVVLQMFIDNLPKAKRIIGHNVTFDLRIMKIYALRHGLADQLKALLEGKEIVCTMNKAKPIVQCPPTEKMVAAGFKSFKNPNLGEAYKHFTGKTLEGAHDALVDVDACREVLYLMEAPKPANS